MGACLVSVATLRKGWVLEGGVLAPVRSVTAETSSGDRVKML